MADSANIIVNAQANGFRNAVILATLISDGSGLVNFKIYDATATGAYGVNQAGQTFYPGIHTTIVGLDYDVQDMKVDLLWDATTPQSILPLGSAPEDFRWERIGGLRCPSGLAGATGSILVSTINQAPSATFTLLLYLRKNIPQS